MKVKEGQVWVRKNDGSLYEVVQVLPHFSTTIIHFGTNHSNYLWEITAMVKAFEYVGEL